MQQTMKFMNILNLKISVGLFENCLDIDDI